MQFSDDSEHERQAWHAAGVQGLPHGDGRKPAAGLQAL